MKLKKYLKYNNIALIDPANEFHKSCIDFYNQRGFLSVKQIQSLRNYVFDHRDIERLTAKPIKAKPIKAKPTSSADAAKDLF